MGMRVFWMYAIPASPFGGTALKFQGKSLWASGL